MREIGFTPGVEQTVITVDLEMMRQCLEDQHSGVMDLIEFRQRVHDLFRQGQELLGIRAILEIGVHS